MIRSTALVLSPAGAAWGALLEVAANARQLPDAARALELASSAAPVRRPLGKSPPSRRGRPFVAAGKVIEVLPGPRRGAPLLEPAAGAVTGLDERREGLAVYRVQAAGTVDGRQVALGSLVLLARRPADRGELVAWTDERSIRLCVAGAPGRAGLPEEGRALGVVEGVIAERQRRRCA